MCVHLCVCLYECVLSTKSSIKGKLEFYPVVVLAELGLWVRPMLTVLILLCIDSGDEYSDSLNSEPSRTATSRQHRNKKVGPLSFANDGSEATI